MSSESTLKSALVKLARAAMPQAVILRHEDQYTAGIPDISCTHKGLTIWWEVKYARPAVRDRGIQHLTCRRLGTFGRCYYLVYQEKRGKKKTFIVHPNNLDEFEDSTQCINGFNHKWVVQQMEQAHDYK